MPLGKGLVMTEAGKAQIHKLSQEGLGYKKIAAALELSVNSVKTYLRAHPAGENGRCRSRHLREMREARHPDAPSKTKTVLLGLMPHLLVERPHRQGQKAHPLHLYLRYCERSFQSGAKGRRYCFPHLLCRSSEKGGERRWMNCTSG